MMRECVCVFLYLFVQTCHSTRKTSWVVQRNLCITAMFSVWNPCASGQCALCVIAIEQRCPLQTHSPHTHTRTPARGRVRTQTHMHACIHMYVHICTYIHIYIYTYIHIYICWRVISLSTFYLLRAIRLATSKVISLSTFGGAIFAL